MAFEPKVNIDLYTDHVRTIEAHTSGEYCRVALDCPETKGNTMIEKKHYLEKHHDDFRTMLMHEPRGHHASQFTKKQTSVSSSWMQAAG